MQTICIKSTIPVGYTENIRKNYPGMRLIFSPEFLNRVDDFIVFRQLSKESLLKIVDIAIDKIKKRLDNEHSIEIFCCSFEHGWKIKI